MTEYVNAEPGSRDLKSREQLGPFERVAEIILPIVGLALVFGFLAAHQLGHTGFFTENFGGVEMLALYGPLVLGVIPPITRAITGQRNPGRLMEVIANAALAAGAWWLYTHFPFDFSHFADVIPAGFQFMFRWVSDGMARIVLMLQMVIGSLTAFGHFVKFLTVASR